jgi:hypothetical protein
MQPAPRRREVLDDGFDAEITATEKALLLELLPTEPKPSIIARRLSGLERTSRTWSWSKVAKVRRDTGILCPPSAPSRAQSLAKAMARKMEDGVKEAWKATDRQVYDAIHAATQEEASTPRAARAPAPNLAKLKSRELQQKAAASFEQVLSQAMLRGMREKLDRRTREQQSELEDAGSSGQSRDAEDALHTLDDALANAEMNVAGQATAKERRAFQHRELTPMLKARSRLLYIKMGLVHHGQSVEHTVQALATIRLPAGVSVQSPDQPTRDNLITAINSAVRKLRSKMVEHSDKLKETLRFRLSKRSRWAYNARHKEEIERIIDGATRAHTKFTKDEVTRFETSNTSAPGPGPHSLQQSLENAIDAEGLSPEETARLKSAIRDGLADIRKPTQDEIDAAQKDFTAAEVVEAIKSLKPEKSMPHGSRHAGVLQAVIDRERSPDGDDPGEMAQLLARIYTSWARDGQPEEYKRYSTVLALKPDRAMSDYNSWRKISMLGTWSNVYHRLIGKRITELLEPSLPEEQRGFRPEKEACPQSLFVARRLAANCREHKRLLYAALQDLTNAFDNMVVECLEPMLYLQGVPGRLLFAIADIMRGADIVIRASDGDTDPIPWSGRLVQGSSLTPVLFNAYLAPLIAALKRVAKGATYQLADGEKIQIACSFMADDNIIFAESAKDLQFTMNIMAAGLRYLRIPINVKKSTVVVPDTADSSLSFTVGTDTIKVSQASTAQVCLGTKLLLNGDVQAQSHLDETELALRVADRLGRILGSTWSMQQKLHAISESVVGAMEYLLRCCSFSSSALSAVDDLICKAVRRILGHKSLAAPVIHDQHGLGIRPLADDYLKSSLAFWAGLQERDVVGDTVYKLAKDAELCTMKALQELTPEAHARRSRPAARPAEGDSAAGVGGQEAPAPEQQQPRPYDQLQPSRVLGIRFDGRGAPQSINGSIVAPTRNKFLAAMMGAHKFDIAVRQEVPQDPLRFQHGLRPGEIAADKMSSICGEAAAHLRRRVLREEADRQGRLIVGLGGIKVSNHFLHQFSRVHERFIWALMRARTGCLYTAPRIHMFKTGVTNLTCPLCNLQEHGLAHVLGGCSGQHGAVTLRHDEVVDIVNAHLAKWIRRSGCSHYSVQPHSNDRQTAESHINTALETNIDLTGVEKWKPDVIIKSADADQPSSYNIDVVEVTITNEDNMIPPDPVLDAEDDDVDRREPAYEHKQKKYEPLRERLSAVRDVAAVNQLTVVFGTRGYIHPESYKQLIAFARRFNASQQDVDKLIREATIKIAMWIPTLIDNVNKKFERNTRRQHRR